MYMTMDKLSYTLADMLVLAMIMLHVRDVPINYATQNVITYSLNKALSSLVKLQNSRNEEDEKTPRQRVIHAYRSQDHECN